MLNKKYLQKATLLARSFMPLRQAQVFTASRLLNKSSPQESFLNGSNSVYAEHMYDQWRKDPQSVHASWRIYFQNLEGGAETPFELPPTVGSDPAMQQIVNLLKQSGGAAVSGSVSSGDVTRRVQEA